MANPDDPRGANRKRKPARPKSKPKPRSKPRREHIELRPKSTPAYKPGGGDTKSDADLGRARKFEKTPQHRKAVRDTYAEQTLARRKQIERATRKQDDATSREAQRFHEERVRVENYIKQATAFAGRASKRHEHIPRAGDTVSRHDRIVPEGRYDDVRKGLGVLKHQAQRQATASKVPGVSDLPKAQRKAEDRAEREDKGDDGGLSIGGTVGAVKALVSGKRGIAASREINRVERDMGPVDLAGRAAMKPTLDAVTTALAQLNRVASASAGGAIAASEGKNVAKGTVEGFKSNDKSYQELVEKTGIGGPAAAIIGLAGDILFDPTTYVSLGFKAPATAAERVAARNLAKKYRGKVKRAAKAGDTDEQNRLAKAFQDELDAARRKAGRHESETRGIQVGVRLPGGRQVQTKGRVTASVGKQATKVTRKVQGGRATREVNEVARAFSPHVRRQGESPAEHAQLKDTERRARALRERTARDGRQLGKFIQRATEGDVTRARQIVDAVEAGTIDRLPAPLREAAERADRFHSRVQRDFEAVGVKPPSLADSVLAKGDLDEALSLAEKVTGAKVATDAADEREIVQRLAIVVDDLRADARTNIARTRTNDELGAVRRGELDDADAVVVRKALEAEDFFKRRAADQRKGGNRQAARSSEAQARAARKVIKARRAEAEPRHLDDLQSEGGNVLKGQGARLERLLGHLQERVEFEPPVGYSPRQTKAAMEAEAAGQPMRAPAGGKTGHEQQRLERRRQADVREDKPDYLSEELPQLEARYGNKVGRRLGELALWKRITQTHARPATLENLAEEGGVIYKVDSSGAHRVDPRDRGANEQAAAELELRLATGDAQDTGYYVVPEQVDELLLERSARPDNRTATGAFYDRALRGWKAMNTILRPGFFATTIAGNTWQMYMADASVADLKDAWRFLAGLRKETLYATNPAAANRKAILDFAAGDKTFVVDGRAATFADLFEEAVDAGAIRTGSRIGDPTELTLEQQAKRRLKRGGLGSSVEWLGELAEDLDDMTKLALYARGRTKLGLDSKASTEFAFSKMIDYSDLSQAERKWFKRLMPFYIYTARNLPIQVKSLVARPGKLANYEKVRQAMAELSGLDEGWEGQRTPEEQERMPVALPGVTSKGFQVFMDPRLPVSDMAAPAQLLEGPSGAGRAVARYASGIVPVLKAPVELAVNRRLDYDREIDQPGYRPPAGWLLRNIPGATDDKQRVHPRTGEKYTGAKPVVDYLLRSLGGAPGSVAAGAGAPVPDRSGIQPWKRLVGSNVAGVGLSASDPLEAVLAAVGKAADERYAKRSELKARGKGGGDAEYVRNEDTISDLRDLTTKIRGTLGYPRDRARRMEVEKRRLDVDEPVSLRAERSRLDALRRQYGG